MRVAFWTLVSWTCWRDSRREAWSFWAARRRDWAVDWAWMCFVRSFVASAWEKKVSRQRLNYIHTKVRDGERGKGGTGGTVSWGRRVVVGGRFGGGNGMKSS